MELRTNLIGPGTLMVQQKGLTKLELVLFMFEPGDDTVIVP